MQQGVRCANFWSSLIVADAIPTELLAKKHHSSSVNLAIAYVRKNEKVISIGAFVSLRRLKG